MTNLVRVLLFLYFINYCRYLNLSRFTFGDFKKNAYLQREIFSMMTRSLPWILIIRGHWGDCMLNLAELIFPEISIFKKTATTVRVKIDRPRKIASQTKNPTCDVGSRTPLRFVTSLCNEGIQDFKFFHMPV